MGNSLSAQEQLFVAQKWPELLEEAMMAEMGSAGKTGSGSSGDSRPARKGNNSNADFRMSFNEWQAFLGILEVGTAEHRAAAKGQQGTPLPSLEELQRGASAPLAICRQLTAEQLHCPLAALAVEAFGLWCGAATPETFLQRLNALEVLAQHGCGGTEPGPSHTDAEAVSGESDMDTISSEDLLVDSSDEESDGAGGSLSATPDRPRHATPEPEASAKPQSKRSRLFNAIKSRVKRGEKGGSSPQPSQGLQPQRHTFLLDEFLDMAYLYRNAAHELISSRGGVSAAPVHTPTDSPRMRAAFRELKGRDTKSRPVARVALCVGLALYCAVVPTPAHAVDGVMQLRLLDAAMQSKQANDPSPDSAAVAAADRKEGGGHSAGDHDVSREPVTLQWPWVARLEGSLVQKQHELDVQQCLGEDGQQLRDDLRVLQERRAASEEASVEEQQQTGDRFARMPPSERWEHCKGQYIGQRHVWAPLTTHFLSADVFEADKPTVLLFFGPSGYGKSELAKQVASAVHGVPAKELEASGKMVYIHMPSFSTKESIYSLVDPPAAHIGDGILLSALIQNPNAVVVLDEFEKSTADAVQNIWLSAFQKHGVLRSLKKAERSTSTVNTTFVLTCNCLSSTIEGDAARYLRATASEKAGMRRRYEEACREVCRVMFGDPFVNRVDYFFPFTPYSQEERQDYVILTLERLFAAQRRKGRRLFVTPRGVAALVSRVVTFHASTIEEVLRPLLVDMARKGWPAAVLTVESRAVARGDEEEKTRYVLLPCRGEQSSDGADAWSHLPRGEECLDLWEKAEQHPEKVSQQTDPKLSSKDLTTDKVEPVRADEFVDVTDKAQQQQQSAVSGSAPMLLEKEMEHDLMLQKDTERLTSRELALTKELEVARQLLAEKDLEIATLKEKVLMLQKLVAVMMCVVLVCAAALYLFIGLQLTLLLLAAVMGFVSIALNIPLRVLIEAFGAFFRFLGPTKSAILVLVTAMWLYQGAGKRLRC